MNIINNIVSRGEQQNNKVIGQTECSSENVGNMLVGMLQSMGMSNPTSIKSSSSKGVKITKKGNTYTLVLSMYQPPITLSWTGSIPMNKLLEIIDRLAQDRKKIGYINLVTLNNGAQFFQLAIN